MIQSHVGSCDSMRMGDFLKHCRFEVIFLVCSIVSWFLIFVRHKTDFFISVPGSFLSIENCHVTINWHNFTFAVSFHQRVRVIFPGVIFLVACVIEISNCPSTFIPFPFKQNFSFWVWHMATHSKGCTDQILLWPCVSLWPSEGILFWLSCKINGAINLLKKTTMVDRSNKILYINTLCSVMNCVSQRYAYILTPEPKNSVIFENRVFEEVI